MLRFILITNKTGNVLLERFHGVPIEERSSWRTFLISLGNENLPDGKDEEQFIAYYRNVYICYCAVADLYIYLMGSAEYDEMALSEVLTTMVAVMKDQCRQSLRESSLLDRYGRVCLALDEMQAQGIVELLDKNRIKRAMRLRPLETF